MVSVLIQRKDTVMKAILRIAIVVLFVMSASIADAKVGISFGMRFGSPPPRRYEVVCPRPYPEAVWAPGFWSWDYRAHHYIWVPGRWNQRFVYREPAPRFDRHFRGGYHDRRW